MTDSQDRQTPELEKLSLTIPLGTMQSWVRGSVMEGLRVDMAQE